MLIQSKILRISKTSYDSEAYTPIYTFFIDAVKMDFTISETVESVQFTLSSGTMVICNLSIDKNQLKERLYNKLDKRKTVIPHIVSEIHDIAQTIYGIYVKEIEGKYIEKLDYDQRNALERIIRCILEFILDEDHPKIEL